MLPVRRDVPCVGASPHGIGSVLAIAFLLLLHYTTAGLWWVHSRIPRPGNHPVALMTHATRVKNTLGRVAIAQCAGHRFESLTSHPRGNPTGPMGSWLALCTQAHICQDLMVPVWPSQWRYVFLVLHGMWPMLALASRRVRPLYPTTCSEIGYLPWALDLNALSGKYSAADGQRRWPHVLAGLALTQVSSACCKLYPLARNNVFRRRCSNCTLGCCLDFRCLLRTHPTPPHTMGCDVFGGAAGLGWLGKTPELEKPHRISFFLFVSHPIGPFTCLHSHTTFAEGPSISNPHIPPPHNGAYDTCTQGGQG